MERKKTQEEAVLFTAPPASAWRTGHHPGEAEGCDGDERSGLAEEMEVPHASFSDGGSTRLIWILGHFYVCWDWAFRGKKLICGGWVRLV